MASSTLADTPARAPAGREYRDDIGEIAYWSPGTDIAIFFADGGQSIPPPGLVRLGVVDGGLEVIGAAGDDFQLTIEQLR